MECIFDTCICGILFWAIGYAFMFGQGNGIIGWGGGALAGGEAKPWFFLQGVPDTYAGTGVPILAHWIFQFAFADTTSTVTSGAMIGRTSFRGDILYSIGVTGFIYPIIGHWAWGPDGWLAVMGTKDHFPYFTRTRLPRLRGFYCGAYDRGQLVSLAGAIVLGPRIGRVFKRDGGGMPAPHNLTIAAVGGFILWFGWYGFNPGSTLSAVDMQGIGLGSRQHHPGSLRRRHLRHVHGVVVRRDQGQIRSWLHHQRLPRGPCGHHLPLLLGITAGCASSLGLVAGIVVWLAINLLEYLRIDDPIGAVAVHGSLRYLVPGGAPCLWAFLPASGQFGATGPTGADNSSPVTGLFYGGGASVLKAQFIGSFCITVCTFVIAFILMWVIKQLPYPWKLRVEPHGETGPGGLDVFEHGIEAYQLTGIAQRTAVFGQQQAQRTAVFANSRLQRTAGFAKNGFSPVL